LAVLMARFSLPAFPSAFWFGEISRWGLGFRRAVTVARRPSRFRLRAFFMVFHLRFFLRLLFFGFSVCSFFS
jgi:hypothetical protein